MVRYRIGGHLVGVRFLGGKENGRWLLPSYERFVTEDEGEHLFMLSVEDTMEPSAGREMLGTFDTGNGDMVVWTLPEGGYEFGVKDIGGVDCCMLRMDQEMKDCSCVLRGDRGMRAFGLNIALMMIYAFAGSRMETLLMHASCVRHGGVAYPFVARSGTGKSTHAAMWLNYVDDTDLINDDNPVIRIENGEVWVYGSPWSGKTPCHRNLRVRLGAITRIERAEINGVERLDSIHAFASLLPTCSTMTWDSRVYGGVRDTIVKIIGMVPVYTLRCRPDREAAILLSEELRNGKKNNS